MRSSKYRARVVVDLGRIDVEASDANARADGLLPAVKGEIEKMDDAELAELVRRGFERGFREETRVVSSFKKD